MEIPNKLPRLCTLQEPCYILALVIWEGLSLNCSNWLQAFNSETTGCSIQPLFKVNVWDSNCNSKNNNPSFSSPNSDNNLNTRSKQCYSVLPYICKFSRCSKLLRTENVKCSAWSWRIGYTNSNGPIVKSLVCHGCIQLSLFFYKNEMKWNEPYRRSINLPLQHILQVVKCWKC